MSKSEQQSPLPYAITPITCTMMKNLLTFLFALLAVSSVQAFMGAPVVSARAKVGWMIMDCFIVVERACHPHVYRRKRCTNSFFFHFFCSTIRLNHHPTVLVVWLCVRACVICSENRQTVRPVSLPFPTSASRRYRRLICSGSDSSQKT